MSDGIHFSLIGQARVTCCETCFLLVHGQRISGFSIPFVKVIIEVGCTQPQRRDLEVQKLDLAISTIQFVRSGFEKHAKRKMRLTSTHMISIGVDP